MTQLKLYVPLLLSEIGTEADYDQLFYQQGFKSSEIAKIEIGKYSISIILLGEQTLYDPDTEEKIIENPRRFLELKEKYKDDFSDMIWDSCWVSLDITDNEKNREYRLSDLTNEVYSSISEVIAKYNSVEKIEEILEDYKNIFEYMEKQDV